MTQVTQAKIILSGLLLWLFCTWSVALSCDSCGRECTSSCGTRSFRTCCFNYLRKRSGGGGGPGLRLELVVLPELAKYRPNRVPAPPIEADTSDNENNQMQILYND